MTDVSVFEVVKRFFARVFAGSRGILERSTLLSNRFSDSLRGFSKRFAKDLSDFFENSIIFR